jgi:transcriptional regulator with GAF, ATPase, and Fis domain
MLAVQLPGCGNFLRFQSKQLTVCPILHFSMGLRQAIDITRESAHKPVEKTDVVHCSHPPGMVDDMARVRELCGLVVGADEGMEQTFDTLRLLAPETDMNIMLVGETGTGKELMAKAVHYLSGERAKPYVECNSGGIDNGMLSSELYGHKKGSFTDARSDRIGKFGLVANGGTIFLDEIGEMHHDGQVKLLRVLENRTFSPVGGDDAIDMKGRVVCATNADLHKKVKEGSFRADLLHRMQVVNIPPFRGRSERHKALVLEQLGRDLVRRKDLDHLTIDGPVIEHVNAQELPGNVRQLRDALRLALLQAMRANARKPVVTMEHMAVPLPPHIDPKQVQPHDEWASLFQAIGVDVDMLEKNDSKQLRLVIDVHRYSGRVRQIVEKAVAKALFTQLGTRLDGAKVFGCNRNVYTRMLADADYLLRERTL